MHQHKQIKQFVYVGSPSSPFHPVIFRPCMSLSAAFMSPLIPSYCTGWLWTAMQVALCIKHTPTSHKYHQCIPDHHSWRLIIRELQKGKHTHTADSVVFNLCVFWGEPCKHLYMRKNNSVVKPGPLSCVGVHWAISLLARVRDVVDNWIREKRVWFFNLW